MTEHRRMVLTGGPGGGKTTAIDLFRRELRDQVAVVPEAATLLFSAGFPRSEDVDTRKIIQRSIYQLQQNLEDITAREFSGRYLICDRGTLDGAAYWPEPSEDFFEQMETNRERELGRYDHVIYFESAARGGHEIDSGNPCRKESIAEAAALDQLVFEIWKDHPSFHIVKNNRSFVDKVMSGLKILMKIVDEAK